MTLTIYKALLNKLDTLTNTDQHSVFFQPERIEQNKPYVSLMKSGTFLEQEYSCNDRLERSIYFLHTYTHTLESLETILEEQRSQFDYGVLESNLNRLFTSMEVGSIDIESSETQIWAGRLQLTVFAQKTINTLNRIARTTGRNILGSTYNRFKEHSELTSFISDLYIGQPDDRIEYPYSVTLRTNLSDEERNTNRETNMIRFSIDTYARKLSDIEEANERIMNIYDSCEYNLENSDNLTIEWVGDFAFEREPQLWQGRINYNAINQRDY